jgi:hypothetical protein
MKDVLPQLFRPLNAIIKGFSISTKTKSKAKLFFIKNECGGTAKQKEG